MPNQRRRKPWSAPSRSTKAVLGRFSSIARECIQESSRGRDSRQTPAGFPAKGRWAKASTWYTSIGGLLVVVQLVALLLTAESVDSQRRCRQVVQLDHDNLATQAGRCARPPVSPGGSGSPRGPRKGAHARGHAPTHAPRAGPRAQDHGRDGQPRLPRGRRLGSRPGGGGPRHLRGRAHRRQPAAHPGGPRRRRADRELRDDRRRRGCQAATAGRGRPPPLAWP